MKRINCRGATMEACATRSGTLVGPLLTEVVGKRELTPYKGGWCGNEIFPGAFSERIRNKARDMAFRFGNQLIKEGYRGYFDLDFLIDEKDGEVYLGELNPRICGASSITNHSAFAYADAPLFLFHLMEFSGVKYKIDVEELNERWARKEFIDSWSQVVMKSTDKNVDISHQRAAHRGLPHVRRRRRSPTTASTSTVRRSSPSARRFSCASPVPATTATRAPIWAY